MPHPTPRTAPLPEAGTPPSPRPIPANDAPPETAPAAGRPLDPAGRVPAVPPAPPAAEDDAPAPPREGAQRAAFDALRLALQEGHVFAALTGPAGTGKTAVLDAALASQSGRRLRIIRIVESDRVTAELAARIERVAQAEAAKPANADAHVVLAVDDAHAASDELLRCLTRLAAAERTMRLPQIFLAGRPSLWDRLAAGDYAPLAVRLAIRPVLHSAPEDPWSALERDLVHAGAGAPTGAEWTPEARFGAAPPASASPAPVPPLPALPNSAAASADGVPSPVDPAPARRRVGAFVSLVVLLAGAGAGLHALARHDWSPERLAAAAWAEAGRHISITRAPTPDPAASLDAVHPAMAPDQSLVAPAMFPEPEALADSGPTPAEAVAPAPAIPPAREAALAPDIAPGRVIAPVQEAAPAPASVPAPASDLVPAPDLVPAGAPKMPPPVSRDTAALETPPPLTLLPAAPAVPAPTPPPRSEDRVVTAVVPPAQPELLALLVRRGDERFALGDLSAARLFYARAASLGSAQAARLVARTYDRAFLDSANAGAAADEHAALAWYRRAATLGDAEASAWLRRSDAGR